MDFQVSWKGWFSRLMHLWLFWKDVLECSETVTSHTSLASGKACCRPPLQGFPAVRRAPRLAPPPPRPGPGLNRLEQSCLGRACAPCFMLECSLSYKNLRAETRCSTLGTIHAVLGSAVQAEKETGRRPRQV